MSAAGPRKFTDYAGDDLWISDSDEPEHPGAMLNTNPKGTGAAFCVAPHKLAEVVTAMYETARQSVPDLPVIHDQAEVKRLTGRLRLALSNADRSAAGGMPLTVVEGMARELLAHGVRLPETTP